MNRLSEKIFEQDFTTNGEQKYVHTNFVFSEFDVKEIGNYGDVHYKYDLRVTLHAGAVLKYAEAQQKTGTYMETKRRLTRFIMEEVYGEFRQDLIDLEYCLMGYDVEKAKGICQVIQRKMFDV